MAGYYDRDRNPNGAFGASATAAGQMNHAYAHHSSVSEYQASGVPFVLTYEVDLGSSPRQIATATNVAWTTESGPADTLGDFTGATTAVQNPPSSGQFEHSGTYFDHIVAINLPYVSRWIMVRAYLNGSGASALEDIKIGFGNIDADDGVQNESYVTSFITNGERLELKCKKIYFAVPGSYAGSDGSGIDGAHGNAGSIKIEVIAGLTSVVDFPDLDSTYIAGISSSDSNGATALENFTIADTSTSSNAS